jgi:hypothetical protein
MKSNPNQLKSRGFLPREFENSFPGISFSEKLKLLKSDDATERTLGARLLFKETLAVAELIQALRAEKKLYTKLEICNALISIGEQAVSPLIAELGKIGKNQYTSIPEKEFEKLNYPLPRDIVARTLAFMGEPALPELLNALENVNSKQLSEAIDAVGYICFYNTHPQAYQHLMKCWTKNIHSDLICWKIVRAMSAFSESSSFLLEQKRSILNQRIIVEIDRSLKLIDKRKS